MFETYLLNDCGLREIQIFKDKMAEATKDALEFMPDERSKSLFITKVEEAVFHGSKAIASKKENYKRVIDFPIQLAPESITQIRMKMEEKSPEIKKRYAYRIKRTGKFTYKSYEYSGNQYIERAPEKDEVVQ